MLFLPQGLGSPFEAVEPEEWPSALLKPFTPKKGGRGNGGSLCPWLFSVRQTIAQQLQTDGKVEKYLGQPSNWHWSGSPSVCFQPSHRPLSSFQPALRCQGVLRLGSFLLIKTGLGCFVSHEIRASCPAPWCCFCHFVICSGGCRPYSGDQSTSGQRGPRAGTFLFWGNVGPAFNEGQDLWFSLLPLLVLVLGGLFAVRSSRARGMAFCSAKPWTPKEGGRGNGGSLCPWLFSVRQTVAQQLQKDRKVEKYLGQPSNWHWSGSPLCASSQAIMCSVFLTANKDVSL